METARCPAGLPRYGDSMQAAAIASALIERQGADIWRRKVGIGSTASNTLRTR